jgi:mannose-1-phosphate guanylyltransferase
MSRWAVVLAGGVGSRFWPLSTPTRPKQLLPLVDDTPMLRGTLDRLAPLIPGARTLVLTNASLVEPIASLCPDLPRENIVAEPRPAGTAAALSWAALLIANRGGPDAVMISVHADWVIGDPVAYRAALTRAADAAERHHCLATVGVVPSRPDPGFGYVGPGDEVEPGVTRVKTFVEKPGSARATELIAHGFLWNSGIFVWRVGDFLDEVRAKTPEVAPALQSCADNPERFFSSVVSISVDHGVLERSDRVLRLVGDFGWDDVGTWAALYRVRAKDRADNAVSGPVFAMQSQGNVVHAEGCDVVLYGVENLVVVSRDGLTLVTTRERAADLKRLIDALPPALRDRS